MLGIIFFLLKCNILLLKNILFKIYFQKKIIYCNNKKNFYVIFLNKSSKGIDLGTKRFM